MDRAYWQSAWLTNNLFWYGVIASLLQSVLSLLPNQVFLLEAVSFILGAIGFITILIASTLAYSYRQQSEALLLSHYQYLIRTLWLMVLFSVISTLFVVNSLYNSVTALLNSALNFSSLSNLAASSTDGSYWLSDIFNLLCNCWLFARVYKARQRLRAPAPIHNTWFI